MRLLVGVVGLLPWAALPALARRLGFWAGLLATRRSQLVLDNIRSAFPGLGSREHQEIAGQFWRNITLTVLEIMRGCSSGRDWVQGHVQLENPQVLDEALKEGRGILLHCGHFANWETTGLGIAVHGYPMVVIARTQNNPYIDRWYNSKRCRFGVETFNHHQAVRETQDLLGRNGILAILMDQNLYKGGIFVDFFGRPAATTTITALLHYRTQSPIVGAYMCRREGRTYVRFERLELPVWNDSISRKEKALRLTQWLTSKIEEWVRQEPANWLWGHNRWKRTGESSISA